MMLCDAAWYMLTCEEGNYIFQTGALSRVEGGTEEMETGTPLGKLG